jgi:hypothetical protein
MHRMAGEFVTRDECERVHSPINEFKLEFKRETRDDFERLHVRIDKIYSMIVGVFVTVAAGVLIQVIAQKFIDRAPPKIEIRIDRAALNAATTQP